MNSFNKTEAAVFLVQRIFPENFFRLIIPNVMNKHLDF